MIKILLVDKYEVVREGLRALILTEPDMIVLGEASSRQKAVEKAQICRPNIVVLDPGSMGHDGIPTIVDLKKADPKITVLVLTNYIDQKEVRSALQAGAGGYVLKGMTAPELIQAIRDVTNGELILHPTIADYSSTSEQ